MNLLKMLKAYLLFILTITAIGSLSYIDGVRNLANVQFASIIDAVGYSEKNRESNSFAYKINYDLGDSSESGEGFFEAGNMNENLLSFEIDQPKDGAFAEPGTSGAVIMDLLFKNFEKKLELNGLKFKIIGVDPKQVKKAYVFDGEKLIALGSRRGGYIVFDDLDFDAENNQSAKLSLKLDIGTGLRTGDRIRLDIEKPQDLSIRVGDEPYVINSYYPIKGEYLSISRARPWGPLEKEL